LRSTAYSKKLIAAIVLHKLPAFAVANVSTVSLNDILSSKEGKGWRKMDPGITIQYKSNL